MQLQRRILALSVAALGIAFASAAVAGEKNVVVYDDFSKPDKDGDTIVDYSMKWANPFGLGEMASPGGDTRSFKGNKFSLAAVPFRTGADFSDFDHLKYAAFSTQSFAVPLRGSLTFSSTIQAETPGAQPGRVIEGTYIQGGAPYAEPTFEGQQAGAVMNMVDFTTGQLFDWFISGKRAFTLIERLPTTVTGAPGVGLDKQGQPYTGVYPSYGPGEVLSVNSFSIGHGLFSLLDAYPFQHPDRPDLAVSIPLANRLFGQGARATFDRFTVETVNFD